MSKNIITLFWALVANFLFIVSLFFIPAINKLFKGSIIFLVPFVIFFLLGLTLLVLVIRIKPKTTLAKFLLLTGISSTGVFVGIFLHNMIYGLFIYLFGQNFWDRIGTGDEPVFFLIALILCPLGFLVGVVGSMIVLAKQRKLNKTPNKNTA